MTDELSSAEWEAGRDFLLSIAGDEMHRRMERAIADLPPRDLWLLSMKSAGDNYASMADALGITEASARKAWHRTKQRVRMAMMRETLLEEIFKDDEQ